MARSDFALTSLQKTDARAALALLAGTEITLEEAARRAIVGRRAGKKTLVPAAIDLFIRSRIDTHCREATVGWYQEKLSRFEDRWEHRSIDSITRGEIRDALEDETLSASTKAGQARALRALWRFCAALEPPITGADVTHGLRTVGPRRGASKTGAMAGRKAFLTLAETEILLTKMPLRYRDALAVMLFAGVRPGEIGSRHKPRLLWSHVNVEDKLIRVPDEVAKTGHARLIQGLPPTLWAWLSRPEPGAADRAHLPVSPVLALQIRRLSTDILGRPLPYDAFRHTFATYAVAFLGEANTVALWLGHEGGPALLFNTYMGLVTESDAKKYFAQRP